MKGPTSHTCRLNERRRAGRGSRSGCTAHALTATSVVCSVAQRNHKREVTTVNMRGQPSLPAFCRIVLDNEAIVHCKNRRATVRIVELCVDRSSKDAAGRYSAPDNRMLVHFNVSSSKTVPSVPVCPPCSPPAHGFARGNDCCTLLRGYDR